jgi:hypothetical protein
MELSPASANVWLKRWMVSAFSGSAPLYATCHDDRSNPARSSGVVLRTHRSNPKLGPPAVVPRKWEMARSQFSGRLRNSSGDIT